MHVWLLKIGEPLPGDHDSRLYRMGLLSKELVSRGHSVVWWTSDFNHKRKSYRFGKHKIRDNENIQTRFIHSPISYQRSVSILRVAHDLDLARRVRNEMLSQAKLPDLIVVSMPTIELARVAVAVGKLTNTPVAVDVRDMWPDIIPISTSGLKRLVATLFLPLLKRSLRKTLSSATAVVSITPEFLNWAQSYKPNVQQAYDRSFYLSFDSNDDDRLTHSIQPNLLDLDTGTFVVLFAGTMASSVCFEHVFVAARELERSGYSVHFVICGSGDDLETFEQQVQSKNVTFTGELGTTAIAHLKQIASAALLPIRPRPDYLMSLSNKFYEYLEAGLPILSLLDGVPGSVLTKNKCGWVYKDSNELIQIIKTLYDSTDLHSKAAQRAKNLFHTTFSPDIVYPAFVSHLETLTD